MSSFDGDKFQWFLWLTTLGGAIGLGVLVSRKTSLPKWAPIPCFLVMGAAAGLSMNASVPLRAQIVLSTIGLLAFGAGLGIAIGSAPRPGGTGSRGRSSG